MSSDELSQLREEILELKKQLTQQDATFSEKRAQFKDLYVKKEDEVQKHKSENEKVRKELKDIQKAVEITESFRNEELEIMKRKFNEETVTLNSIMRENLDMLNKSLADKDNIIQILEKEKIDLITRLDIKNQEITDNTTNLMTKLAQRLKLNTQEILKTFQESGSESSVSERNDSHILKEFMAPYEEDAKNLKDKIRVAYEEIDKLENELKHFKTIDITILEAELSEVHSALDLEKKNNQYLANSLDKANNNFFVTEKRLLRHENIVKTVLTEEQKVELEKLMVVNCESMNFISNIKSEALTKSMSGDNIHLRTSSREGSPYRGGARRNTDVQSLKEFSSHQTLLSTSNASATTVASGSTTTRIVSEKEWTRIQQELRHLKTRSRNRCEMCDNYEDQLQRMQSTLQEKEKQLIQQNADIATQQRLVDSLKEGSNKLSCHLTDGVARQEILITGLKDKLTQANETYESVRTSYDQFRESTEQKLKTVYLERLNCSSRMDKIETLYDNLLQKHAQKASEMAAEKIDLPETLDEAQICLLRLKESLIENRAAVEHLNERVHSTEVFSKQREAADRSERDGIMEELGREKWELEERLVRLEAEIIRRPRASTIATTTGAVVSRDSGLDEAIHVLKTELETVKKNFTSVESENRFLKSRLQSLQQELENSESVQKDFVKLSQTLQIQLESLRQQEKELRWQFDEDVHSCQDCQTPFGAEVESTKTTMAKRQRCLHCCRIFCAACLQELAPANRRGARSTSVCRVCHTMLVKEAVPYFSLNN